MAPDSRGWGSYTNADEHTLVYHGVYQDNTTSTNVRPTGLYADTATTATNDYHISWSGYDEAFHEKDRKISKARKRWLVFTRGTGWEEPTRSVFCVRSRKAWRTSIRPALRETPRRSRPPRHRSFKQVRRSLRKQLRH
jgi:hypothetical protein